MDIASEMQMLWMYSSLCSISGFRIARKIATLTNVGQLLERRGKEFLGSKYRDPISSFSDFQEFSVLNPEVVFVSCHSSPSILMLNFARICIVSHYTCLASCPLFVRFIGKLCWMK